MYIFNAKRGQLFFYYKYFAAFYRSFCKDMKYEASEASVKDNKIFMVNK